MSGISNRVALPALTLLAAAATAAADSWVGTATYRGELATNHDGGIATGSRWLNELVLRAGTEDGGAFGIASLDVYGSILLSTDNDFSGRYVGDAQVVSNFDSGQQRRIYEAWAQWRWGAEGGSSVLAGLYDVNREFDTLDSRALFLGSAHGIGTDVAQSGANGPSIFPVTGLAVRFATPLAAGWNARVAVVEGTPGDADDPSSRRVRLDGDEGALLIAELQRDGERLQSLKIGAWSYTARFEPLDPLAASTERRRAAGAYLSGEWRLVEARDASPGLHAFLRIGAASDAVHTFDRTLAAGLVSGGWLPARFEDRWGLAVAHAGTGRPWRRLVAAAGDRADSHETAIELSGRARIASRLALQASLQYVVNPGADAALDDAFVSQLRVELDLSP